MQYGKNSLKIKYKLLGRNIFLLKWSMLNVKPSKRYQ